MEILLLRRKMNRISKIPWPRVLGEGLIIIVSILLAFWIQAWWDARQDRSEEIAVLQSLLGELQELEQDFGYNEVMVDAMRASIRKLLEASASGEVSLGEKEVDHLLADSTYYVDPTMVDVPVLESLISTGELTAISNSKLRHEFRDLLFDLRNVRLTFQHDFDFGFSQFGPYLAGSSSLLQIWNRQSPMPGFPEVLDDFEPILLDSGYSNSQILSSREFQNLVLLRDTLLSQALGSQRSVTDKLASVMRSLENELRQ